MAARIWTTTNSVEISELAEELARLAETARRAAEELGEEEHGTDGWCNSLDGLDSLAKMLGGIVGQFRAPPAKLLTIRAKISAWRQAKKAAQEIGDEIASKKGPAKDNSPPAPATPKTPSPAQRPPAQGRKRKA